MRRLPPPRGDPRLADTRRAPRDPARHDAHARHRHAPEDVSSPAEKSAIGEAAFQGKGFRSLGQEAIYAAAIRLRRGDEFRDGDSGAWRGDVIAPVIRDLGATLAMRPDCRDRPHGAVGADGQSRAADARQGSPHRRLSRGASCPPPRRSRSVRSRSPAWRWRSRATAAGALPCRSSAKAARRSASGTRRSISAPRAGCRPCSAVENNQTALSTPVRDQSAARVFADKASGYGIPGITIDGTDPDEIAAAFAWAVERARAGAARRSSSSSRCACAATRTTTTCCISARTRSPAGSIRRSTRRATPTRTCMRSGRRAIRFPPYAARLQAEELIDEDELGAPEGRVRGASSSSRRQRGDCRAVAAAGQAGEGVLAGRAATTAHRSARPRRCGCTSRPTRRFRRSTPAPVRSRRAARSSRR